MSNYTIAVIGVVLAAAPVAIAQPQILFPSLVRAKGSGDFTLRADSGGCVVADTNKGALQTTMHVPCCNHTITEFGGGGACPFQALAQQEFRVTCDAESRLNHLDISAWTQFGVGDIGGAVPGGSPGHSATQTTGVAVEFLVTDFTLVLMVMRYGAVSGTGEHGASAGSANARFYGPIGNAPQSHYRVDHTHEFEDISTGPTHIFFHGNEQVVLAPGRYRLACEGHGWGDRADHWVHQLGGYISVTAAQASPGGWADRDNNNVMTVHDLFAWLASPTDVNGDGTIDSDPYGDDPATLATIIAAMGNLGPDCDGNSFPDAYDILVYTTTNGVYGRSDINDNNIPDVCEPCEFTCRADTNCDTFVNSADFFEFLTALFTNAPAADFNRDTAVNSQDYFDFLAAFFVGC